MCPIASKTRATSSASFEARRDQLARADAVVVAGVELEGAPEDPVADARVGERAVADREVVAGAAGDRLDERRGRRSRRTPTTAPPGGGGRCPGRRRAGSGAAQTIAAPCQASPADDRAADRPAQPARDQTRDNASPRPSTPLFGACQTQPRSKSASPPRRDGRDQRHARLVLRRRRALHVEPAVTDGVGDARRGRGDRRRRRRVDPARLGRGERRRGAAAGRAGACRPRRAPRSRSTPRRRRSRGARSSSGSSS